MRKQKIEEEALTEADFERYPRKMVESSYSIELDDLSGDLESMGYRVYGLVKAKCTKPAFHEPPPIKQCYFRAQYGYEHCDTEVRWMRPETDEEYHCRIRREKQVEAFMAINKRKNEENERKTYLRLKKKFEGK